MAPVSFAGSGFFVLRTPLLPYATLTALGEDLSAARSVESGDLAAAHEADRARVVERMRMLLERADVREALFVASPSLDAALARWLADPDQRGQGVDEVLFRYVARMSARAMPFGLFSGCSLGAVRPGETHLVLGPRAAYRRHTRLDALYLSTLSEALETSPRLRPALRFRPSSGLVAVGGKLHYAKGSIDEATRSRTYELVAIEPTPYLLTVLARASGGATPNELVEELVRDPEIATEDAVEFVGSLVEAQILVSDLAPVITGPPAIDGMIESLHQAGAPGDPVRTVLEEVRAAMRALDAAGLGHSTAPYRAIARRLADASDEPEVASLVHVDLFKPAPALALGPRAMRAIEGAVELVTRLAPAPRDEAMSRFEAAFADRYGDQVVPLATALDDEVGIGFSSAVVGTSEPSALLDPIRFPPDLAPPVVSFGAREQCLLRGLGKAFQSDLQTWSLDDTDLRELALPDRGLLPDAFAFMGTLAATSRQALDGGDVTVVVDSVTGPSGAVLLGRFCHGDPALRRAVEEHLRAEESSRPDAVFAEIVHLPEGKLGNLLARPMLRSYEIPYLGRSGAPVEHQIAIDDLRLRSEHGRLVLSSERLGCEVIPRMSTAHRYDYAPLGIYRFLCALQRKHLFKWSWGALENAPRLPRVVHGRVVLARAQWSLVRADLEPLRQGSRVDGFRAVQELRRRLALPRWVALFDADLVLPFDLENVVAVSSFIALAAGRERLTLVEVLPGPDELVVEGPEGRYVHEVIVPFVRTASSAVAPASRARTSSGTPRAASPLAARRTFAPGSEWLYAKIYTGKATADHLLDAVVRPLVTAASPERWFFLRYADPGWHLRLRIRGEPARLLSHTLPMLHDLLAPFLEDGRVSKVQLDTYHREIERYGGDHGIDLAERLFEADSVATLAIVGLDAVSGTDARWRLALRGMHLLLTDLGLDLTERAALLASSRASFAAEHHLDTAARASIGAKYRVERSAIDELIETSPAADHELDAGFSVLEERSARIAPIATTLRSHAHDGRLTTSLTELARSLLHMHAIRLLRSDQRMHEAVLYDFLSRAYDSQLARQKRTCP